MPENPMRKPFQDAHPPVRIFVHGVSDGDLKPSGWWLNRRYAKTSALEMVKLIETYLFV